MYMTVCECYIMRNPRALLAKTYGSCSLPK